MRPHATVPLFDAHCHLQEVMSGGEEELDARVCEIRRQGCGGCVVNGTGPEDWGHVASLARFSRAHGGMFRPAFGLHPWQVSGGTPLEGWVERLRALLEEFPEAAIGEAGLDKAHILRHRIQHGEDAARAVFHSGGGDGVSRLLGREREVLAEQLRLARELGRVVVLHCVRAFGTLETLLRELPPPRGFLLHGYSGSPEQARGFARMGGWFSFGPRNLSATAGHAEFSPKTAAVLRAIPVGRVLLETDFPSGRAAFPASLPELLAGHAHELRRVHEAAARHFGLSLPVLGARIHENHRELWEGMRRLGAGSSDQPPEPEAVQ
ncbi:MAG: TatD family hydrolase [Puniceicoccales bacterium]|jgi:TatD DNase family protein|nr:TatD family hydrolase [Puniceicoccales bacterium]